LLPHIFIRTTKTKSKKPKIMFKEVRRGMERMVTKAREFQKEKHSEFKY